MRLRDLGEWELLRRLAAYAPSGQFNDDAALLEERSGQQLVVNTDVLVEGVHFSDATIGPRDLGWRAAAANLSDLAAMGCTEVTGITVALVAPGDTAWSWVERVYAGLRDALEPHGAVILGGDCSSGAERLLSITALGRVAHGTAIGRDDGRPGDWLVSSGPHGLSRLGLALLLDELEASQVSPALRERAIEAHRRPKPRLDVAKALHSCRPSGQAWRVGGTDSSDGLTAAVGAIAATSGCGALLERSQLPIDPELAQLEAGERWCLGGGEDFELVLSLPPSWAEALLKALPGASRIGSLVEAVPGLVRWQESGEPLAATESGFTHFR
ncbi:MAG: thiamine-phosphate kinase [Vulcanococcus sp.]|uniref:thiamine-phosphate kinase n=1 Tax=Vulcanococcus sp. TaxID=2856995 RepID=UPI0025F25E4E|nr:thiamine-phosphate kinase [Vulcanococcus sp.]MBW0167284.1 thiamine-phosphate kinase [Vulcanococcus sp.]